jgi:peptidoglycan/LPS O-acetylase OafA/YrhL
LHSASTGEGRYKNIDVLRGIAALFVVWLHASEVLVTIPAIKAFGTLAHDVPAFLQLGRAGVIAFFAISGFVVASTIKPPKGEGTAHFATKRLLRLYPAYWLALALTYLLIWVPQGRIPDAPSAAANVTMLPTIFGVESAMGHFWTLEIEFVFYLLVVVLFLAGKLRDPRFIVPLTCLLALKPAGFLMGKLAWTSGQGHWGELPLCLAIMLWGSLLRASYDPSASARQKLRAWATWPIAICTVFVLGRSLNLGGIIKGVDPFAWLAGLGTLWGLLLFIAFALCGQRWPRFMVWCGTASYSIYLFHPVIFYPLYFFLSAHPQYAVAPLSLWLLLCAAATVAFASVTYLLVEAPANRLGARLARRQWTPPVGSAPSGS